MLLSIHQQYMELHTEWMFRRELEGYVDEHGHKRLSDEGEGDFASRLDDLWWKMSEEEQVALEADIEKCKTYIPIAPADLGLVDVFDVSNGPRKSVKIR